MVLYSICWLLLLCLSSGGSRSAHAAIQPVDVAVFRLHDAQLNYANNLVAFNTNLTRCPMFSATCRLFILVNAEFDIERSVTLHSADDGLLKVKSIRRVTNSSSALGGLAANSNEVGNEVDNDDDEVSQTNGDPDSEAITKIARMVSALRGPSVFDFFVANYTVDASQYHIYEIALEPLMIGLTALQFRLSNGSGVDSTFVDIDYNVLVLQPDRFIDKVFTIYAWTFMLFISFTMGLLLDVESLLKIAKMPVPVAIGLVCQYMIMPLLAFSFTYFMDLAPIEALTLFIYGCSPGGSASNNWTIVLNGDIDLSAIMTLVSTVTSLGMMPLWIYTLGSYLTEKANISLPFMKLLSNLLATILPCMCGLALTFIWPKLKDYAIRFAKYITLFKIVTMLCLLIYCKFHIFQLIKLKHWLIGPLIPWIGFLLSGLVAFLLRFSKKQIITISLETGIQNFGVAFLIILNNFPNPESDYAFLPLFGVALLTPLPLYCYSAYRGICKCVGCYRNRGKDEIDEKESGDNKSDDDSQEKTPYKLVPTTAI